MLVRHVSTLAVLGALVVPAGAAGHEAGERGGRAAAARAWEERALGTDHAAEHASARRAAAAWDRLPAPRRRALLRRAAAAQARQAKTPGGTAASVGRWTRAPFALPTFAIHSAVVPTGEVMFWGWPALDAAGVRPNEGRAFLWDPARGTGSSAFTEVRPPRVDVEGDGSRVPAPIFCSGASLMADGRLLVVGGTRAIPGNSATDRWENYAGAPLVLVFDPVTRRWSRGPDTRRGRWYPSQVLLADGRTVILGGYDERAPGGVLNPDLEVFTPRGATGVLSLHPRGTRRTRTYPNMFLMPGGDVFLAGPGIYDYGMLDTDAFGWRISPQLPLDHVRGNFVLRPVGPAGSSRVTAIGGLDFRRGGELQPTIRALGATETVDLGHRRPAWRPGPPLRVPRSSANTVTLPDGTLVVLGGGNGSRPEAGNWSVYADGRARRVELLGPRDRSWRLGPAQLEDRGYHSTAVLLPDGRVFSAGDDHHPLELGGVPSRTDTGELYSPPYLFRGPRPRILSAPRRLRWGASFVLRTSGARTVRAVLAAPGATTHGTDMSQRIVPLRAAGTRGGLALVAPPRPDVAPPGWYMLFALSDRGVPSVASWVRLRR